MYTAGRVSARTCALIVSAGNSYASPVRKLYTEAGKITGTAFFSASTSITSAAGAGVGAGEDDRPPEAVASLPHSGSLRRCSCVLGLSAYRACWKMPGDRGVCGLECCLERKLQGVTSKYGGVGLISCQTYRSVRYQIDVVPILPKCPIPVSMLYRFRYRPRYICEARQYFIDTY